MFQENKLNADARCQRASDLYPHTPWLTSYRGLGLLKRKQPDPNFAGPDEVGDSRVGDLLRIGDGRNHQQSTIMSGTRRLFFTAPPLSTEISLELIIFWVSGVGRCGLLNPIVGPPYQCATMFR